MQHDEHPPDPERPPGRQFGLRSIFLFTLVIAVTAAVWGGLTRDGEDRLLFIFFAAAAPCSLVVLLGLWQELKRLRRKR